MRNNFQSKSVPRGTRTIWRYLGALFILFTFAIGNVWAATDFSQLNYSGGNAIPAGYTLSSKNTPTIADITSPVSSKSINISDGGASDYSAGNLPTKRFMTFVIDEGCSVVIKFTSSSTGRTLNLVPASTKTAVASVSVSSKNAEHTLSYEFSGITSATTYYLCGTNSSNLYIYSIQFTPTSACTETAPTSVAVSGGATYDKGDALSNLSAAVTGGTGTMSYQWYCNTTDAATVDKEHKIDDATSATLAPYNKVGTRYYYCVASNCAGSVTSGTTAVTINPVCPPSGTIYKFQVKTGLTSGNLVTSVPKDVDMTTDNYLSALVGGELMAAARKDVNRINITGGNAIGFANGADAYLEMTLDCAIQAGDIIKYTIASNNMLVRLTSASTEENQLTLDRTKTQVEVPAAFVGATKLYMIRASSSPNISYFEVFRPVYRTITLEYADGTTPDGSLSVLDGTAATKPADPTWEHHRFAGWYNEATPYDWTANVTGDITLTAHWTQLYTISFNNGGGSGDAPAAVADKAQGETFTVPENTFTAPTNKEFDIWNDGSADYAPGVTYTVGTANVVLTAQWKALQDKYTVIFKDGDVTLDTKQFDVTTNPSDANIEKTKPLYTFAAWQKDAADIALDDAFWATVEKDAEITLTARWEAAYASSINVEQWVLDNGAGKGATTKTSALLTEMGTKNYLSNIAWVNKTNELDTLDDSKTDGKRNYAYLGLKVKNDASNVRLLLQDGKSLKVKFGNVAATPNIKIGDAAATAMTITDGVYSLDAASGDREITISTTSAGAVVFKQIMINEEIQNVILPAIVTLDANGGTYTDESVKYTGTPLVIGDATPADAEHIFEGWHVGTVEGAKIDASAYVPTANVTLVAKYVVKPSPFSLTALTYTIGAGEAQNVGYVEGTYTYTVELPYAGSYENITVAATLKEAGSSIVEGAVMTVTSLPGAATFTVSDGAEGTQLYTINFKKAAKDGVEIIGVVTTGSTNKTVSGLYKGDASVSLANDKKIGNNNYIYVTLAEGYTFEETDVLVVDVKAKSDLPNDPALEITTGVGNINGSVWKSIANADYELNLVTIPLTGIAANQTSIGLKRSDHQNTWVNGLKVYRPMNPVLTAIQFNETDVEVTSTAVAATLPNGTNLSTMTVTPTIAWNGAGTATPTAAWAWGPNTYRVTDKDGDYTDYTITLTEAIPAVDPTLTYNEGAYMVGASALDLSTLIDEANSDGEITYTVKTDGGTSATITDGKFTATAAGTATITATQAATVAYNAKTADFNVVVTVATEIDGIKLVEAGALTGKFVTASTLSDGAYTIEGINYAKYIKFNSTFSGSYNSGARNNYLIYDLKKENTTFHVYAHNNTSTAYKIVAYAYDDVNAKVAEVEVAANENAIKSFSLNDITKNTRVFIGVENNNIYFCQVVAVESGADLMKAGEPGYSIDFGAKSRFTAASGTAIDLDGMEFVTSSGYTPNSSTEVGLGSIGTNYVKFKLDAPTTVEVRTNSTNQYYIGSTYDAEAATSKTYGYKPTSNGETHSFDLTAGTWYLNPNTSNIKLTKLAFSLPKCEKPTITAQPATKQTFGPGNLTATVVADDPSDGGTLKYQWYVAATDEEVENATEATLTTTTPGTYYVIVTNTLADHSDNSVKSDEATLGYRVTDDATLSVLKYGETAIALEDDVYNYNVELAKGTTDVPALSATATMDGYANVAINNATAFVNYEASSTVTVKSEDLTETNVYTVNFYVKHDLPQVDVTESTTWDWTNAATTMQTIKPATKNVEQLMANIDDNGKKLKNDAEFNSQALFFSGQEALVGNSTRWYAKGGHIKFNVTVPGIVKVEFSDNGENNRRLKINDLVSDVASASETDVKTFTAYVMPGKVTLMGVKNDGTGTDQYIRISKITFTAKATPDYSRDVTNNIGTLCVDHNVLVGGALGATFYQIASRNELYNDKIDFEEVLPNEELKAGEPYIFKSTTGRIDLFFGETKADAPVAVRGMIGNYEAGQLAIDEDNQHNILYIAQNKLWSCENLVGQNLILNDHRAYIDMAEVPTYAKYQEAQQNSNSAPRRRVTLGKDAEQIATGFENINAADKPMKLMINGQIFILRGEKMYDATGRLVK
jgi:hypothetical protein